MFIVQHNQSAFVWSHAWLELSYHWKQGRCIYGKVERILWEATCVSWI